MSNFIYCRIRGAYRVDNPNPRYVNFSFQNVDGKVVLSPCDPVAPALASEYSVTMNALRSNSTSSRQKRINCDVLDLGNEIEKLNS